MAKTRSLREAKREAQVIDLPRDNYGFNNWTIMTDGHTVWISKQKIGEQPTDSITVPKGVFDRLLMMYERPQQVISDRAKKLLQEAGR